MSPYQLKTYSKQLLLCAFCLLVAQPHVKSDKMPPSGVIFTTILDAYSDVVGAPDNAQISPEA